jgi:hypothetical protein
MISKNKRLLILISCLIFVVFFASYSFFGRTFLNSDEYLAIAYDYTGHDPHILNWQEPKFEIIQHKGRLAIHITYHTDEDETRGPYSFYIDPFRKVVFDEDPRR